MAVIDVESRFQPLGGVFGWSRRADAGNAVLAQGARDERHQLTQVEANMRMGCAILRYYLRRERMTRARRWRATTAASGAATYPDLVVTRWTTPWNGADDLGLPVSAAGEHRQAKPKSSSCITRVQGATAELAREVCRGIESVAGARAIAQRPRGRPRTSARVTSVPERGAP